MAGREVLAEQKNQACQRVGQEPKISEWNDILAAWQKAKKICLIEEIKLFTVESIIMSSTAYT